MTPALRLKYNNNAQDFAARFSTLREARAAGAGDVSQSVSEIIAHVRRDGDGALIELTAQYDRMTLTPQDLRISADEIAAARAQVEPEICVAIEFAAARIAAFHESQRPQDTRYHDAQGVELGSRWTPCDSAGLYVPGGTASYPSSVLMNAVPAKIAGVKRRVMVVPTPDGVLNPLVLVAAECAGIDEIYRIGGAQAIAALAYGTASIAPVDVITGPGNAYVAEAKRQVFGRVGIDMIAGPSEVLVVAARDNDPAWIAADLLAQAEHDGDAQSILICDDSQFGDSVERAVAGQLKSLTRAEIAQSSWQNYGVIIEVDNIARDAPPLINHIAPEHLQLAVDAPETMLDEIHHAGAIFMGRFATEAIGDYLAGPNHVLPTSGSARFASGLSVLNFMKRSSLIGIDAAGFATLAEPALTLARAEGLDAHANAIAIRSNGKPDK